MKQQHLVMSSLHEVCAPVCGLWNKLHEYPHQPSSCTVDQRVELFSRHCLKMVLLLHIYGNSASSIVICIDWCNAAVMTRADITWTAECHIRRAHSMECSLCFLLYRYLMKKLRVCCIRWAWGEEWHLWQGRCAGLWCAWRWFSRTDIQVVEGWGWGSNWQSSCYCNTTWYWSQLYIEHIDCQRYW